MVKDPPLAGFTTLGSLKAGGSEPLQKQEELIGVIAVLAFHQTLPEYNETPLHELPPTPGVGCMLVKDELARFGLPAFKILGAPWAVYRAVGSHVGADAGDNGSGVGTRPSFADVGAAARRAHLRVVTVTEGNCGRAVARMAARHMGLPTYMTESTRARIRSEGEECVEADAGQNLVDVVEVDGSYEETVPVAFADVAASDGNAVMVLDVGIEGFDVVPTYFVQGYNTMLAESDRQVLAAAGRRPATHVVVPAGAGSIAEAVTAHFRGKQTSDSDSTSPVRVLTVELTTAACLLVSLRVGVPTTVPTGDTIMCGMSCGMLSTTAWPVLQTGVDAVVSVTDAEAHAAVEEFKSLGVLAGPCGTATLAALKKVCADGNTRRELGLDESSVIVLYCTEGAKEYPIPL
ncbi:tryptophan synthase beta subunit-like PLP-dependent enzyme [Durotheca rogersii]|uniref:tryptophan synthase beta subunit-like PLP-dependent enzyme n=1 Tax=Durotheca rogersii TaxID=419775 RepID=UPI0022207395|nr:tryptophan synthase beta subunit-like PLP-dependent enzyme [Durotheca rogersii]KAI5859870.1 tryptophan synthase beta subunit-like PLP-dependent enzyme [Durotheca rogersii]